MQGSVRRSKTIDWCARLIMRGRGPDRVGVGAEGSFFTPSVPLTLNWSFDSSVIAARFAPFALRLPICGSNACNNPIPAETYHCLALPITALQLFKLSFALNKTHPSLRLNLPHFLSTPPALQAHSPIPARSLSLF